MIDEIGRDVERPNVHRLLVSNEARAGEGVAVWNVRAGSFQNLVRGLANIHRNGRADIPCQAVVVLMWMRDDHTQQVVVGLSKTRDARKQSFVSILRRVKRQPDIEHDALSLRLDFDAGATDLLRPPMDTDSHMPPCPSLFIKVRCLRPV